mmetsp:Transcript_106850/g.255066  ORF Transcript_106850/g.255066 Transcript_106850/m.255066 type:complete len:218 (+) Transcript_106850:366-1019(+)
MSCTFASCDATALLSPPPRAEPQVTVPPSFRRAAKAMAEAQQMLRTSVSSPRTLLLSPPAYQAPQVTTEPSHRSAAKAAWLAKISFTSLSSDWTALLSPPLCAAPQVTTLPSALRAANAACVERISRTCVRASWTALLSPPQRASPQQTTDPSSRMEANARERRWMKFAEGRAVAATRSPSSRPASSKVSEPLRRLPPAAKDWSRTRNSCCARCRSS